MNDYITIPLSKNGKKHKDNTSGYKGVSWHKGANRWIAMIYYDGKYHYLGLFDTPELAYEAYKVAAKKHHEEFARFE